MGFVSKPKLEGFGLDSKFPFTVHGRGKRRVSSSLFKKKQFTINDPNQHCCLKRQSYNDFPHIYIYIYIYVGSVFLLMTRIIGFFKPFFRYHLQDLKYSILICLEEVFFSCLLKVFSQNTCWDQLYVSFNFEV